MKRFKEANPNWKGGRALSGDGRYITVNRRLEHIVIAENALGKPLPNGAVVHHHDSNGINNRNNNLVICQNRAYHAHIHKRMRILAAGFNPDTHTSCPTCKTIKPQTEFHRNRSSYTGLNNECKPCVLKKSASRYRRLTVEEI